MVAKPAVPGPPTDAALGAVLGGVPPGLRDELVAAFSGVVRNYRHGRWEPSELDGGKLCEIVYSILRGLAEGAFPPRAAKPPNMAQACLALEKAATLPRPARIQIPRMLVALYEIRNNRSVGHVGGDVGPNHMDASVVLAMSKWIVAELVRIFHDVDTERAAAVVDALADREVPLVWTVGDKRRVLNRRMTQRDKALILLYSHTEPVADATLAEWAEITRVADFRSRVLRQAHKDKLIEYDSEGLVHLSPLGSRYVEQTLLRVG